MTSTMAFAERIRVGGGNRDVPSTIDEDDRWEMGSSLLRRGQETGDVDCSAHLPFNNMNRNFIKRSNLFTPP